MLCPDMISVMNRDSCFDRLHLSWAGKPFAVPLIHFPFPISNFSWRYILKLHTPPLVKLCWTSR